MKSIPGILSPSYLLLQASFLSSPRSTQVMERRGSRSGPGASQDGLVGECQYDESTSGYDRESVVADGTPTTMIIGRAPGAETRECF